MSQSSPCAGQRRMSGTASRVKLVLGGGGGGKPQVRVGGRDIAQSVAAVKIEMTADERRPRIVLTLRLLPAEVEAEDAAVTLDENTSAVLIGMGWTPPRETG